MCCGEKKGNVRQQDREHFQQHVHQLQQQQQQNKAGEDVHEKVSESSREDVYDNETISVISVVSVSESSSSSGSIYLPPEDPEEDDISVLQQQQVEEDVNDGASFVTAIDSISFHPEAEEDHIAVPVHKQECGETTSETCSTTYSVWQNLMLLGS